MSANKFFTLSDIKHILYKSQETKSTCCNLLSGLILKCLRGKQRKTALQLMPSSDKLKLNSIRRGIPNCVNKLCRLVYERAYFNDYWLSRKGILYSMHECIVDILWWLRLGRCGPVWLRCVPCGFSAVFNCNKGIVVFNLVWAYDVIVGGFQEREKRIFIVFLWQPAIFLNEKLTWAFSYHNAYHRFRWKKRLGSSRTCKKSERREAKTPFFLAKWNLMLVHVKRVEIWNMTNYELGELSSDALY